MEPSKRFSSGTESVYTKEKGEKVKEIERKLISELLKNSRRSDRELAKAIGISQPTTTRLRTKLEKEGFIREYTIIPNFSKIGYNIMSLNFLKLDPKLTEQEIERFRQTHPDAMGKDLFGVVSIYRGIGLGYDSVVVSFHQNFASYDSFRHYVKQRMGASVTEMNTFLVNLGENINLSPTFSFLARQFLKSESK